MYSQECIVMHNSDSIMGSFSSLCINLRSCRKETPPYACAGSPILFDLNLP